MGEIGVHGWKNNLSTRTFFDLNGDGVSQDNEQGLSLVPTNIRYRDGSISNLNSTDLEGFAGFNEVFPIFNWYVMETDSTRYKNTGTHVINDAGGPVDGSTGPYACGQGGYPACGTATSMLNMARTAEDFSAARGPAGSGRKVLRTDADCPAERHGRAVPPAESIRPGLPVTAGRASWGRTSYWNLVRSLLRPVRTAASTAMSCMPRPVRLTTRPCCSSSLGSPRFRMSRSTFTRKVSRRRSHPDPQAGGYHRDQQLGRLGAGLLVRLACPT